MIERFGFFADAVGAYDARAATIAANANLNWYGAGVTLNDLFWSQSISHKAVVDLNPFLFDDRLTVLSNAKETIAAWFEAIRPAADAIFAIQIADEPWGKNKHIGLLRGEVTRQLDLAALIVKTFAPTIPVMVSFDLDEYDVLPTSVDFLAGYHYSYNTAWYKLHWDYWRLTQNKRTSQRIVVVADAYSEENPTYEIQKRIINFNKSWRTCIASYGGNVVAVCPFIYQSGQMVGGYVWGADSMPFVLNDLANWAAAIRTQI